MTPLYIVLIASDEESHRRIAGALAQQLGEGLSYLDIAPEVQEPDDRGVKWLSVDR